MMAGGRVRQQLLVSLPSFCPPVAGIKFVILYQLTITRGIYEVDSCDEGKAISSLLLALFFPNVFLFISSSFFLIYGGWGLVLGFWVDGGWGLWCKAF